MSKFCAKGHQMEDSWETCPTCQTTGYQVPGGTGPAAERPPRLVWKLTPQKKLQAVLPPALDAEPCSSPRSASLPSLAGSWR